MDNEDLLDHILREILLMEPDDILLLRSKRITHYSNLKHMTFSRLMDYKNDGTLYDGDYEELRLFLMYLAVYLPTMKELEKFTSDDWNAVDHVDLQERFYGLQLQPRTPRGLPKAPTPAPPPAPAPAPPPPIPVYAIPDPEPDPIPPESRSIHSGVSTEFSSEHLGTTVTFTTPGTTAPPKSAEEESEKNPVIVKLKEKQAESESDDDSYMSFQEGDERLGGNKQSLLEYSSDEESANLEHIQKKESFLSRLFGSRQAEDPLTAKKTFLNDDDDSSIGSDDTFLDIRTFRSLQALRRREDYIYEQEVNFFPNESDDEGDDDSDRTEKKRRMYDDILAHKNKSNRFSLNDVRTQQKIEQYALSTYKTPAVKEIQGMHGKLQNIDEFYLDFMFNRRWKGYFDKENVIVVDNDYNRDVMAGKTSRDKRKKGVPELIADDSSEAKLEDIEKYENDFHFDFNNDRFRANVNYSYSEGFIANQKEKEAERLAKKREATALGKLRKTAGIIVNNNWVQLLIIFMIVINCLMMGIGTYGFVTDNPKLSAQWELIDSIFLVAFTIELLIQFTYKGLAMFFDGWLLFDFFVIVLSWMSDLLDTSGKLQILRAFRIFRAFRLIVRVKTMKDLVTALINTLPSMMAILFLLLIIMFIFAVMFTSLVSDIPQEERDTYDDDTLGALCNFSTMGASFFTLFQFLTLDGFADVVRAVMKAKAWYVVMFMIYIVISGFVVINLVIAVICDSVSKVSKSEKAESEEERILTETLNGVTDFIPLDQIDLDKYLKEAASAIDILAYNQEETMNQIDAVASKMHKLKEYKDRQKLMNSSYNDTEQQNGRALPDFAGEIEEKKENMEDSRAVDISRTAAMMGMSAESNSMGEPPNEERFLAEARSKLLSGGPSLPEEESGSEYDSDEDSDEESDSDEASESDSEYESESDSEEEEESDSEEEVSSLEDDVSESEDDADSLDTELDFLGSKKNRQS